MNWLALDIGGANIKASDGDQFAVHRPFHLWREPDQLVLELRQLLAEAPKTEHLAVTMTGELVDCFSSKAAGVNHILATVQLAAAGRHIRVYTSAGRLVTCQVATRNPATVAAANWHALASFCCRFIQDAAGLLIDVGSTTTDVIPLTPHNVVSCGVTDTERLLHGSLVYTGVERSPVCAVSRVVPYRGGQCRVAQEYFATMRDVYMLLGKLPEDGTDHRTADGEPATKKASRARLGRMLCADDTEFHHRDAAEVAQSVARDQLRLVADALHQASQQWSVPSTVVISGQGDFLAGQALQSLNWDSETKWFSQEFDSMISVAAPAFALAVLARERGGA